jgi:hypothetical protein
MKEVFDELIQKYKSSPIEAITGVGKMYSYEVPEGTNPPYVVNYMDPSNFDRDFNNDDLEVMIVVSPISSHAKGQDEINKLKNAVIDTYDGLGPDNFDVKGYTVVHVKVKKFQQILDDTEPDNKLWHYPVKLEVKLSKGD